MMQPTLAIFLVALSTALFFATSPIALGLICLMMAFSTGALLLILFSIYFGLLGILVYVGGLLVMFAYFLAICPNQLIALKTPMWVFSGTVIVFSLFLDADPAPFALQEPTPLAILFDPSPAPILIFLALVLLLTMIVVVKITTRKRGPLRPFK